MNIRQLFSILCTFSYITWIKASIQPVDITGCIEAFRRISNNSLAVANVASVDISLIAIAADSAGFQADIGNYDFCMRDKSLQHCLAGSVPLNVEYVSLAPFSGICVPAKCNPLALSSHDVKHFVEETLAALISQTIESYGTPHVPILLSDPVQQKFSYFVKLKNIFQLTRLTNTGYTCGDHRASMTVDRYIFFTIFALLLATVIISTAYHMATSGWSFESLQIVEEKKLPKSTFRSIAEGFSLVKNLPFIFSTRSSISKTFAVLDGFRVISILWIILGHTLATSTSVGVMNPASIIPPQVRPCMC